MDRQELDERASAVIKEHGIDPSEGYDIVSLAKSMGFFIATASLDDGEDGFIMVNDDGEEIFGTNSNKVIVVEKSLDQHLKRFVIAHELGHYEINGRNKPIFAHRKKRNETRAENEQEVDYFAASLLMPKEAFCEKNRQLSMEGTSLTNRTLELTRIFSAPMESVLRRMDELGLLAGETGA